MNPSSSSEPERIDVPLPEEVAQSIAYPLEATQKESPRMNWDVLGIASVAISLVGAAIFYVSGWVYEAHWFGFYGIHLSQIDISPPLIMIHGVPGIIVFIVAIFLAQMLFAAYQAYRGKIVHFQDFPVVILIAFVLVSLFLILLFIVSGPLPLEVLSSPDIFIPLLPFAVFIVLAIFLPQRRIPASTELSALVISSSMIQLGQLIGAKLKQNRDSEQTENAAEGTSSSLTEVQIDVRPKHTSGSGFFTTIIEVLDHNLLRDVLERVYFSGSNEDYQAYIEKTEATWKSVARFSLGLTVLFAFLTSIAFSALMGEIDARRGARIVDGNRKLTLIYLHSDVDLKFAPRVQNTSEQISGQDVTTYGPFGLVAVNERDYFLTDWNDNKRFTSSPNLYVIPRNESSNLQLFKPAPTVTPTPTVAPTSTPLLKQTPPP